MPRLPRPHIPLAVKCTVAVRQLGFLWPDQVVAEARSKSALLDELLTKLAGLLGCEVKDLRLDHQPPLAVRDKVRNRAGEIVAYVPDANDPEHLIYRTAHAHHIKTNVRGDGAQFPDRVLIKRERHREKKPKSRTRKAWGSRPFPARKVKIPSRPFPKGKRKLRSGKGFHGK